jgi:hypothetical protein
MSRTGLVLAALVLLTIGGARAQTVVIQQRPSAPEHKGSEVRIQVNISFFVAGAVNSSEASLKIQEDARRALYQSAAKECEVLQSTIAGECRLEQVSVNMNRTFGQGQTEGVNASGNFAYKVTLK